MSPFTFGLAILLVSGVWCLVRVRTEYRTRGGLLPLTAAAIWSLYSFHFVLSLIAAVKSDWHLPSAQPVNLIGGLLCLLSGAALFAAGMTSFRSLKRISGLNGSELITGGVYRWSRNPQNVGWTFFLVGVALLGSSGLALLLAVLFWLSFQIYLPAEERLLEEIFGEAYRGYRSRTHRYLGLPKQPHHKSR